MEKSNSVAFSQHPAGIRYNELPPSTGFSAMRLLGRQYLESILFRDPTLGTKTNFPTFEIDTILGSTNNNYEETEPDHSMEQANIQQLHPYIRYLIGKQVTEEVGVVIEMFHDKTGYIQRESGEWISFREDEAPYNLKAGHRVSYKVVKCEDGSEEVIEISNLTDPLPTYYGTVVYTKATFGFICVDNYNGNDLFFAMNEVKGRKRGCDPATIDDSTHPPDVIMAMDRVVFSIVTNPIKHKVNAVDVRVVGRFNPFRGATIALSDTASEITARTGLPFTNMPPVGLP